MNKYAKAMAIADTAMSFLAFVPGIGGAIARVYAGVRVGMDLAAGNYKSAALNASGLITGRVGVSWAARSKKKFNRGMDNAPKGIRNKGKQNLHKRKKLKASYNRSLKR